MPRSTLLKTLFAWTLALGAAQPALAQSRFGEPETPEERITDAFETPYADFLVKTFVTSVRKNADAACLQQKALDDAAIAARSSALLQHHGTRMLKLIDASVDHKARQKIFLANAGPRAVSELAQIKRDVEVQTLLAISWPADLARTVSAVTENFDQYLAIGRIKLDPISPAARGEEEPQENPTVACDAAAKKFIDTHPSKKRINRYLDLVEADDEARRKAIRPEAASKLGPMAYFAGADRDLAELCIGRK
jgi:hypothetical protein